MGHLHGRELARKIERSNFQDGTRHHWPRGVSALMHGDIERGRVFPSPPGEIQPERRRAPLADQEEAVTDDSARYLAERGSPFEPFTDFCALSAALADGIVPPT